MTSREQRLTDPGNGILEHFLAYPRWVSRMHPWMVGFPHEVLLLIPFPAGKSPGILSPLDGGCHLCKYKQGQKQRTG